MYGLGNQIVTCAIRKLFNMLLVKILMNSLDEGNN